MLPLGGAPGLVSSDDANLFVNCHRAEQSRAGCRARGAEQGSRARERAEQGSREEQSKGAEQGTNSRVSYGSPISPCSPLFRYLSTRSQQLSEACLCDANTGACGCVKHHGLQWLCLLKGVLRPHSSCERGGVSPEVSGTGCVALLV